MKVSDCALSKNLIAFFTMDTCKEEFHISQSAPAVSMATTVYSTGKRAAVSI